MTTNNNVALPELAATTDKHGTRLEKPRQLRQNSRTAPKGCKDEDNSIAWLEVAVTTSEGDEQPRDQRQRTAWDRGDRHGAQHGEEHQSNLLAQPQLHAKNLRDEQHHAALVQRRAAHVHGRAEREDEPGCRG